MLPKFTEWLLLAAVWSILPCLADIRDIIGLEAITHDKDYKQDFPGKVFMPVYRFESGCESMPAFDILGNIARGYSPFNSGSDCIEATPQVYYRSGYSSDGAYGHAFTVFVPSYSPRLWQELSLSEIDAKGNPLPGINPQKYKWDLKDWRTYYWHTVVVWETEKGDNVESVYTTFTGNTRDINMKGTRPVISKGYLHPGVPGIEEKQDLLGDEQTWMDPAIDDGSTYRIVVVEDLPDEVMAAVEAFDFKGKPFPLSDTEFLNTLKVARYGDVY